MLKKKCAKCGKIFSKKATVPLITWKNKSKYCSVLCAKETLFKKGSKLSDERKKELSKKMKTLWKNGVLKPHKHTEETKNKIKKHHIENNTNMKENVGYASIHSWIKSRYGKPTICEECGNTENIQWSNKDHRYSRDISTWQMLCVKCHKKYDIKTFGKDKICIGGRPVVERISKICHYCYKTFESREKDDKKFCCRKCYLKSKSINYIIHTNFPNGTL